MVMKSGDVLLDIFVDILLQILVFDLVGSLLMDKGYQLHGDFMIVLNSKLPQTRIVDCIAIQFIHDLLVKH